MSTNPIAHASRFTLFCRAAAAGGWRVLGRFLANFRVYRSSAHNAPPLARSVPQVPLADIVVYSFQAILQLALWIVLALPIAAYCLFWSMCLQLA
jgi:hypothetical protein